MQLLVTGATGNVGQWVLHFLAQAATENPVLSVVVGSRRAAPPENDYTTRLFNFADPTTYAPALEGITGLFLMRPPELADIDGMFAPLIETARAKGLQHIAFLSVQGADTNKVIPHHKIEKLLESSGMRYTHVRAAYFMQNLTGALLPDLKTDRRLYVPAGNAKFNWVHARDVGRVAAHALLHPETAAPAYTVSGPENLSFTQVAQRMSSVLGVPIGYTSPNLLRYALHERRQGTPWGFIAIKAALHYLPRFGKAPYISADYQALFREMPTALEVFLAEERPSLLDTLPPH